MSILMVTVVLSSCLEAPSSGADPVQVGMEWVELLDAGQFELAYKQLTPLGKSDATYEEWLEFVRGRPRLPGPVTRSVQEREEEDEFNRLVIRTESSDGSACFVDTLYVVKSKRGWKVEMNMYGECSR